MFRWIQLAAVVILVGVALATITRQRTARDPGIWYRLTHKRISLAKLRILFLVLLTTLSTISGVAWIATKVGQPDRQGRAWTLDIPIGGSQPWEVSGYRWQGALVIRTSIRTDAPEFAIPQVFEFDPYLPFAPTSNGLDISIRLWFPTFLFGAYPAVVFFRGPFRNWFTRESASKARRITISRRRTAMAIILAILSTGAALICLSGVAWYDGAQAQATGLQTSLRFYLIEGQVGLRYYYVDEWRGWQPKNTSDCPTPGFSLDDPEFAFLLNDPEFTFTYSGPPPIGPPAGFVGRPSSWHSRLFSLDWGRFDEYGGLVPSVRCPPLEPTRMTLFLVARLQCHGLILAGVLGAFPILYVRSLGLQRQRRRRGQCTKCGYNLTGNTSSVCPECGTAVHTPASENNARNS